MSAALDLIVALLVVVAGIFGLVGSWGLVKLPDTMTRLHAPTKAATLGVGGVLIASMIAALRTGQPVGHELLITLFLLLTAPVTALFIAKSVIHRGLSPADLPPAPGGAPWAVQDRTSDTGADELPRRD